jgi:hypothetical protein
VRPRVDVDAVLGLGQRELSGRRGADGRLAEERRARRGRRELRAELPEAHVLAALAHEAQRREVPERGRAAVAERDLVPVGQVEQLGEARADAPDERAHRRLAVGRAEQRATDRGQGLDLRGADLAGAGAEPAVDRQQVGGDGDRRDRGGGVVGLGHGADDTASGAVGAGPPTLVASDDDESDEREAAA